jgi:hypothetical protein
MKKKNRKTGEQEVLFVAAAAASAEDCAARARALALGPPKMAGGKNKDM